MTSPPAPTQPDAEPAAQARPRWRLGLLAAAAVVLFGLYPLVALPLARGRDWNGALPYVEADEHAYAAYVRALADGRPRRSDPYSGRDHSPDSPIPESFFSIQLVPSQTIALAARALRLDASAAFALVTLLVAVLTPLVLFRLLADATGDERLSAAGALLVLCVSTVPTVYGPVQYVLGTTPIVLSYPPFLRRYVPALPFPVLLLFYLLVRRALTCGRRRARIVSALLAVASAGVLVYSYFYLWTTAFAWALCLLALWLAFRPEGWRAGAKTLAALAALAAAALPPYFMLVARRDPGIDISHQLTDTRAPDLFRTPELLALGVLLALAWGARRKLFRWREPPTLFALSFVLLPFAVLNQHVVTGRSLQPIHYELYAANFSALLACVLAADMFRRALWPARAPKIYARALAAVSLLVLVWGAAGTVRHTDRMRKTYEMQDRLRPVALRLAELGRGPAPGGRPDTRSVVFAAGMSAADYLPTVAPQPVLWAPHMFVFPGVTLAEDHERLTRQLYFTGVRFDGIDETNYRSLDTRRRVYLNGLVGNTRDNPNLSLEWQPITAAEIRNALRSYTDFADHIDRERAGSPLLSYAVAPADGSFDFTHLDRFYERDAGEPLGHFILHRLKLRP